MSKYIPVDHGEHMWSEDQMNAHLALQHRLYVSGWMMSTYLRCIRKYDQGKCVLVWEGDAPVSVAIRTHYGLVACFTKKAYRKKGYGKEAMKKLEFSKRDRYDCGIRGSLDFFDKCLLSHEHNTTTMKKIMDDDVVNGRVLYKVKKTTDHPEYRAYYSRGDNTIVYPTLRGIEDILTILHERGHALSPSQKKITRLFSKERWMNEVDAWDYAMSTLKDNFSIPVNVCRKFVYSALVANVGEMVQERDFPLYVEFLDEFTNKYFKEVGKFSYKGDYFMYTL